MKIVKYTDKLFIEVQDKNFITFHMNGFIFISDALTSYTYFD